MITDIRDYFHQRIIEVDADLLAWESDLFGNNDQSKPRAEKYYNLIVGNNSPSRDGNSYWDNIEVSLEIYTGETTDLITAFNSLYEKAIAIKNAVVCMQNYNNLFSDIEVTLIEPQEQPTNDNSLLVRLEFIVRRNLIF